MTSTSHFELARNFISSVYSTFAKQDAEYFCFLIYMCSCARFLFFCFYVCFFQLKIQYYARAACNFCLRHVAGSGLQNAQMSHSNKGRRYLISLGDKTSAGFINLRPPHFFLGFSRQVGERTKHQFLSGKL